MTTDRRRDLAPLLKKRISEAIDDARLGGDVSEYSLTEVRDRIALALDKIDREHLDPPMEPAGTMPIVKMTLAGPLLFRWAQEALKGAARLPVQVGPMIGYATVTKSDSSCSRTDEDPLSCDRGEVSLDVELCNRFAWEAATAPGAPFRHELAAYNQENTDALGRWAVATDPARLHICESREEALAYAREEWAVENPSLIYLCRIVEKPT